MNISDSLRAMMASTFLCNRNQFQFDNSKTNHAERLRQRRMNDPRIRNAAFALYRVFTHWKHPDQFGRSVVPRELKFRRPTPGALGWDGETLARAEPQNKPQKNDQETATWFEEGDGPL